MSSFSEYFLEKQISLKETYNGDCLVIARELAKRMINEGKQPYIAMLVRFEQRGENRYYGPIIPKKYKGKITWTRHYVCCCNSEVYDPMLEKPVCIDKYSRLAFGIKIPMETFIPATGMQDYLNQAVGYARAGLNITSNSTSESRTDSIVTG